MKFKFINPFHAYYADELMLRWEVLRKPLGLPPVLEITPEEVESIHLLIFVDKALAGCIVFHPEAPTYGKIIQLALSEEHQGLGLGRKLVHALEQELIKRGFSQISLSATHELQPFYEKLGYHLEKESCEMKKTLIPPILKTA